MRVLLLFTLTLAYTQDYEGLDNFSLCDTSINLVKLALTNKKVKTSALLLSNGHSKYPEKLVNLFPQQNIQVFASDYEFPRGLRICSDQVFQLKMDNSQDIGQQLQDQCPFVVPKMDMIYMKRGLCYCNGNTSCGGINFHKKAWGAFIYRVLNALDFENPHAFAYLHGLNKPKEGKKIIEILREIECDFPKVQMVIIPKDTIEPFKALLLKVK